MSFRFEEKIILHISDYFKIKSFLISSGGFQLYPKRQISSLYFDNFDNEMYLSSEEGSLPRKKIRIRSYPSNINTANWFLETKISSAEGRYKISKKIDKSDYESFLKKGFFDQYYGMCYPKIWVTYDREYYSFLNHRITLDQKVEYRCFKSSRTLNNFKDLIMEVKSNNTPSIDFFESKVPFQRVRFSKYCEGYNKLFNRNENQRLSQIV
jgi:hypothetical protein